MPRDIWAEVGDDELRRLFLSAGTITSLRYNAGYFRIPSLLPTTLIAVTLAFGFAYARN